MDEKAKAEAEARAFEQRQMERELAAEAKTSKNRAKRMKRKAANKGSADKQEGATSGSMTAATASTTIAGQDEADGSKRRKLGGAGSGFTYKKPGQEEDDEPSETPSNPTVGGPTNAQVDTAGDSATTHAPTVDVSNTIVIRDED